MIFKEVTGELGTIQVGKYAHYKDCETKEDASTEVGDW